MAYTYSERNLFEYPENYFYADCASPDFLADWQTSRTTARSNLLRVCENDPMSMAGTPLPRSNDTAMAATVSGIWSGSLNVFLRAALASLAEDETDETVVSAALEPLAKKYEVFKRLFSEYGEDGRRIPNSALASPSTYAIFAACLAELARRTNSLRLLSTLLKLNDALSSIDAERFDRFGAALAARSMAIEDNLVSEWQQSIKESCPTSA